MQPSQSVMRSRAAGQSREPKAPKEYASAGGNGGGGEVGGGASGGGATGTASLEHTAARSMVNGPAGSESVFRKIDWLAASHT